MDEVKEWIASNIIVSRFPVSKELEPGGLHHDCRVVINVSDEFWLGNAETVAMAGKLNYFFPMGEKDCEMGLSSLYGALFLLYSIYIYHPDWKVLMHCQAGKNRSPSVRSAFYYMMTSEHEPDEVNEKNVLIRNNRFLDNCERGHLPPLEKMELFLTQCKSVFDNSDRFLGGLYDYVIEHSGLSKNHKIIS